jgi:hypothetical protein
VDTHLRKEDEAEAAKAEASKEAAAPGVPVGNAR